MDANPYALLFDDEPTAQERAEALAAALRGQAQQVQQRDALASIASMGQNPLLQGFARGQLARVGQQEAGLRDQQQMTMGALERRPQMQLQRQNLAELQRRQAALADPSSVTSQLRTSLTRQFGGSIPDNSPGNSVDDKELELLQQAQAAKLRAQAQRALLGVGAGAMSDAAIDAQADQWAATNHPPNFGRANAQLLPIIATRMLERHPGIDLAKAGADYHANSKALSSLTEREATTGAFEATAEKNLDNFIRAAEKVPDTGNQTLNQFTRYGAEKFGNEAMSSFRAAHEAAASEASKVLSGALGAGAVSDSGRHAAELMLNPNATIGQLKAAAATLRQDMAARATSQKEAIEGVRGRITGKAGTGTGGGGPTIDLEKPAGPSGPGTKQVIGYRYNGAHTKRIPVYADKSEGPVEDIANGK